MERTQENGVRRPPNPYILFSNENRKTLCLKYPDFGNREISRILGILWIKLDPKQKQQFVKRAAVLRAQHRKENPEYVFNPWIAKKLKQKKEIKRKIRKLKELRNLKPIELRTNDCLNACANQLCKQRTSGAPQLIQHEVEPMTEDKRIFMKCLGLCRTNSSEYIKCVSKHNSINYRKLVCIEINRIRINTVNAMLNVKRPRGRPRKDSKAQSQNPNTNYSSFENIHNRSINYLL